MYLHLGEKTVVSTSEIIGIFDMDTSTVGKTTRNFLTLAQRRGQVVNVSYELPKAFVLCAGKTSARGERGSAPPSVYISQISTATLRKRSMSLGEFKSGKG